MNRLNKIFKILAALSLIFLNLTPNFLVNASITNNDTAHYADDDYAYIRNHIIAEYGYDFYINHNQSLNQIYEFYRLLPTNRLGEVLYPEDFGGLYIDAEGNLVVLKVNSVDAVGLISRFSEGIIVKNATFSYNQIMETHRHLTYLFVYHYNSLGMSNVAASWTDIVNNRLVVYLTEHTEELVDIFRNEVINYPVIVFYQHVPLQEEILNPHFNTYTDTEKRDFSPMVSLNESPYGFVPDAELETSDVLRGPVRVGDEYTEISPLSRAAAWRQISGHWYLYNNGQRVRGWALYGGNWYFLHRSTGRMQEGWTQDGPGYWYFLNPAANQSGRDNGRPHGAMLTGWRNISGHSYFMNPAAGAGRDGGRPEGVMLTGWRNISGNYFFLNPLSGQANHNPGRPGGARFASGSFHINGIRQHFNTAGVWIGQNIVVVPGDAIFIGRPGTNRCSAGFRIDNGGRIGFATAAHCGLYAANNTRVYNTHGQHIGTIRSRFLGNIDAASVEVNQNVIVEDRINNSRILSPFSVTPSVGQLVFSMGSTNGLRSGIIRDVNMNQNLSTNEGTTNFRVVNTTIVNFRSDFGDSGGVAFSPANGAQHNIQGIVITRIGNTYSRISSTSEILSLTGWRLR